MRIMKDVQKTEQVIDEVICDVCGGTCMVPYTTEPNSHKEFVGIHIQQPWGYLSNGKDLELWEADICEKCVDEWLAHLVKFHKTSYIKGRLF
jgi:hypothetical protein